MTMSENAVENTMTNAVEGARTIFAMESPIINLIAGLLIAYVVIYFITFWLGPILFGLRPYRPWPVWPIARAMHHVTRRAAEFMEGESAADLSAKVASAIQRDTF
ncbi:unnamed protein product [Orchesella dallaii]|uniref:Uncharacterized protein n=1 Tax=Orchesella dallaii TaxID=48710 RepID=A0ABP1RW13_9HEXA